MISIIIYYLLAMLLYGLGEYYSKIYALAPSLKMFGIIIFIYSLSSAAWLPAIQKIKSLSVLGTIWNISYMVITLFLGLVIFKETLTINQIWGIIFGFTSIVLLSI